MVENNFDLLAIAISMSYIGMYTGFALSFIRLLVGPTFADRIIALDLIGYLTIGFISIYTIDSRQKSFLDIAITLALVVFLSTVAFAKFIAKDKDFKE